MTELSGKIFAEAVDRCIFADTPESVRKIIYSASDTLRTLDILTDADIEQAVGKIPLQTLYRRDQAETIIKALAEQLRREL